MSAATAANVPTTGSEPAPSVASSSTDTTVKKESTSDSLKQGGTLGWIVPLMIAVGLALLIALIVVLVQTFTSTTPTPVTGLSGITGTTGLTAGPDPMMLLQQQQQALVILTTGARGTLLNAEQGLYLQDSNESDGVVNLVDQNMMLENNIQCTRLTLTRSRLELNGFALQTNQLIVMDGSKISALATDNTSSIAIPTVVLSDLQFTQPVDRIEFQRHLVTESKFVPPQFSQRSQHYNSRDWISARRIDFSPDSSIVVGEKELVVRCDEWHSLVNETTNGTNGSSAAATSGTSTQANKSMGSGGSAATNGSSVAKIIKFEKSARQASEPKIVLVRS